MTLHGKWWNMKQKHTPQVVKSFFSWIFLVLNAFHADNEIFFMEIATINQGLWFSMMSLHMTCTTNVNYVWFWIPKIYCIMGICLWIIFCLLAMSPILLAPCQFVQLCFIIHLEITRLPMCWATLYCLVPFPTPCAKNVTCLALGALKLLDN